MNKVYLALVMALMTVNTYSQNLIEKEGAKINYVDDNNLKQGLWRIYSEDGDGAPEGDIILECEFTDGKIDGIISVKKGKKLQISITPIPNENKASFKAYKRSKEITGYMKRSKKGISVLDLEGNEFSKSESNWIKERLEFFALHYGGSERLKKIIHETSNIKNINGKKGRIHVSYMVDENGYIINAKVVKEVVETKDAEGLLAKEALRIVNSFPRMQPAFQGFGFVKISYTVPIVF